MMILSGHDFLKSRGTYTRAWGIGRHLLGSQMFDYRMDTWQRIPEHRTDGDLLNGDNPPNLVSVHGGFGAQWGDGASKAFVEDAARQRP